MWTVCWLLSVTVCGTPTGGEGTTLATPLVRSSREASGVRGATVPDCAVVDTRVCRGGGLRFSEDRGWPVSSRFHTLPAMIAVSSIIRVYGGGLDPFGMVL